MSDRLFCVKAKVIDIIKNKSITEFVIVDDNKIKYQLPLLNICIKTSEFFLYKYNTYFFSIIESKRRTGIENFIECIH